MSYDQEYFDRVFSPNRMRKYFNRYPNDQHSAIEHYECNIILSQAFYPSLSVLEVALRNALSRELQIMTGREDWYAIFPNTPGLTNLNKYISPAKKQISARHENISPSKIVAELTLGFWVSLLNSEYERVLWKDLRRAFPHIPKQQRQRKNISAPLNKLRQFRNRIFHNEAIAWNLEYLKDVHDKIVCIISCLDRDLPSWLSKFDNFEQVYNHIQKKSVKSR